MMALMTGVGERGDEARTAVHGRPSDPVESPAPLGAPRGRWRLRTVRGRVLAMMLAFMLLGLIAAGTVSYSLQFAALEARIDAELRQEIGELELASQQSLGQGPVNLDELLRTAIGSVVPGEYESVLALVDGEPRYQPEGVSFSLAEPEALQQIRARGIPGRTVYTDLMIDGVPHRAAIASVDVAGDGREGVFAVANQIAVQRDAIWRSAGIFAATSLGVLLLALIAGQMVSGRLMRPLEELRDATESISPDDLDRRVTVPAGDDDVAALARTFNTMLDRIGDGFAEQRRFMSDVSHELRTPLTIIHGTLETTDADDPADVEEGRRISLEEIARMGRLVGDLSTLAQSRRPDFTQPGPIDLAGFGPRLLARIEQLGDRDWLLESDAAGIVLADEAQLIQAVVQLAANAVRFTEPGSRIRLRISTTDHPGWIVVALRDHGVGIPAQHAEAIFDRFVQLPHAPDAHRDASAGSAASAGSGLGLAIVRAIAQGHAGFVHVESRPGEGAEFVLTLPSRAVGDPASPDQPTRIPSRSPRRPR